MPATILYEHPSNAPHYLAEARINVNVGLIAFVYPTETCQNEVRPMAFRMTGARR